MKLGPGIALLLTCVLAGRAAVAQVSVDPSFTSTNESHSGALASGALVVIVADEPADAVAARLERDLRSLGLTVLVLSATLENSSTPAALERVARGFGGVAAVRVLANARGSQVWIFEPNRTLTRSAIESPESSGDPNEVALGVVELLRASILELHSTPHVPFSPPPERAGATKLPAPNVPTFALSGGVAAELGLRSVGPSVSLVGGAWLHVRGCLGVRGFAATPLFAEKGSVPDGRVEVETLVFGAGLSCSSVRRDVRFWPRVGLGFASARVVTRGIAVDPVRSSAGSTWLGGGYGMLGVSVRLTRDVRLYLDGTGVLLPTPAIISAGGREVGTWGAPAALISLGVEALVTP